MSSTQPEKQKLRTVTGGTCPVCSDFVYSSYGHDFQTCACGGLSLDGGQGSYIRVIGSEAMKVKLETRTVSGLFKPNPDWKPSNAESHN
jgi:hypothetical protein